MFVIKNIYKIIQFTNNNLKNYLEIKMILIIILILSLNNLYGISFFKKISNYEEPGILKSVIQKDSKLYIDYKNLSIELSCDTNSILSINILKDKNTSSQSYSVVNYNLLNSIRLNNNKVISGNYFIEFDNKSSLFKIYKNNKKILSFEVKYRKGNRNIVVLFKYDNERFFGIGGKTGDLELTGRSFLFYNYDAYGYNYYSDPIYFSIPYLIAIKKDIEYSIFFDSPARSFISLKKGNYYYETEDDSVNIFVFVDNIKQMIEKYTYLTGKPFMPPIYSFGYHQSRYSYMSEDEIYDIVSNFISNRIPLDAIYLDIDFMENYNPFTYNKKTFPNPFKMNENLKKSGIKTVAIVDPGIQAKKGNPIYEEGKKIDAFVKYQDKEYYAEVWPGSCVFPDFTKEDVCKWWGLNYTNLLRLGITGFWNDMNEPAVFDHKSKTLPDYVVFNNRDNPKTHNKVHNAYGLMMAYASYTSLTNLTKKRVFLLNRASYSGIQRYAFVWTGDNTANYDHLKMNLNMVINFGLCGIPFTGSDIGGFVSSPTEDLFVRWIQLGAFIPFFRNHTAKDTPYQEPYVFNNYLDTIRRYIQMRYKLLPYIYTEVYKTVNSGLPIIKPLFLEYGKNYIEVKDCFLMGDSILVYPVLENYNKNQKVILPKGRWYAFFTNDILKEYLYTNGTYNFTKDIKDIPIFVKEGTILPLVDKELMNTEEYIRNRDISFMIFPDSKGYAKGELYYDDGESFNYKKGDFMYLRIYSFNSNNNIFVKMDNIGTNYNFKFKFLDHKGLLITNIVFY